MAAPRRRATPAVTNLEGTLRRIEQGDLISFGAVAIVGSRTSQITAGVVGGSGPKVVSVTIGIPSGWYAVLTQDCDIVRLPEIEPCLATAPVLYVPDEDWRELRRGLLSWRRFPLEPDLVAPLDDTHAAATPPNHSPVVDLRYISSFDKTALLDGFEQRFPLRGRDKPRFSEWVAERFGREAFPDVVHDEILPVVRRVLAAAQRRHDADANKAGPSGRVAATCSDWWVRSTDRYVEVMGRRDPDLGRRTALLRPKGADIEWNDTELETGCRKLSTEVNKRIGRSGHTVKLVVEDFEKLPAAQFETFAALYFPE